LVGLGWRQRPFVLALEDRDLAAQAGLANAGRVELREAERALANPRAQRLHGEADPAADAAEIGPPVVAAPGLVPGRDDAVAPEWARRSGGEQREVRERRRVHDVEPAPAAEELPQHAEAEHERRQDPAPVARVQRHPRADDAHIDAIEVIELAVPLAQR